MQRYCKTCNTELMDNKRRSLLCHKCTNEIQKLRYKQENYYEKYHEKRFQEKKEKNKDQKKERPTKFKYMYDENGNLTYKLNQPI